MRPTKRFLLVFGMLVAIILSPLAARADEPLRYHGRIRSYGDTIRLNVYPYNYSGIRVWSFSSPPAEPDPCFPYGCGGISGPYTNPDPREPDEIPSCYYDQNDVLFFEKEGSTCPYKRPTSPNTARIEKRRQEWLRTHPQGLPGR